MIFVEALEFAKKFPTGHPKIFKGFVEWGIWDTATRGYVVIVDVALASETCYNQLEDYATIHKLRINHFKNYLMICSPTEVQPRK
jgi:hypothetical protein